MRYFLRRLLNKKWIRSHRKASKRLFFKLIDGKRDGKKLMINIGGGEYTRKHWKVLDYPTEHYNYKKIFIDYCHDLTSSKPLPLPNDSVTFFYSSNALEHIPQEFCQHTLNEIYRCLKPNGAVRLTMPDFDKAHQAFGKNKNKFFVQKYQHKSLEENFIKFFATFLHDKITPDELRRNYQSMAKEEFANFYTQQISRDSQKEFPGYHLNWWNYEKLQKMLSQAGFKTTYCSTPQASHFPEMRGKGRGSGFDSSHPEVCFFAEAVK